MNKYTRRGALLGCGAVLGGLAVRQTMSSNPSLDGTRLIQPSARKGVMDDASGLSETPIFKHVVMKQDPGDALVSAIRSELAEARAEGRPVNVGAARHSMGGQAIPRDGHAVTFENGLVDVDQERSVMRCHAGARWSDVISTADPLGLGPKVMQSNNDFGVAATFCVNAHGWPVKEGPMGSTVRAFDMVLPDGDLINCSPSKNTDLFDMTMGGYGLTGIITQMEVDLLPNQRLLPSFEPMPAERFGTRFIEALSDPEVTIAYGRLSVDRADFMSEALMITYRAAEDQSDLPAAAGSGAASRIASRIYRAQLGLPQIVRDTGGGGNEEIALIVTAAVAAVAAVAAGATKRRMSLSTKNPPACVARKKVWTKVRAALNLSVMVPVITMITPPPCEYCESADVTSMV